MIEKQYQTLTETIYQRIKKSIIQDKYKNNRLILNNLANELNVSITPVREALKKLEKDGLIVINPNKGAVIKKLTFKDICEIYDIRLILESLAVESIFKNKRKNFLERLDKLLTKSEKVFENNNEEACVEYCCKFHKLLVSGSDNTRLIKFYNMLDGQLSFLIKRKVYFSGESKRSLLEHRKIFEAIKQNNQNLAKRNIKEHIEYAKNGILKKLYSTKFNPAGIPHL